MRIIEGMLLRILKQQTNVSFDPGIILITQLIKLTIKCLEKDGKLQGNNFEVPSEKWAYFQFPLNNPYD